MQFCAQVKTALCFILEILKKPFRYPTLLQNSKSPRIRIYRSTMRCLFLLFARTFTLFFIVSFFTSQFHSALSMEILKNTRSQIVLSHNKHFIAHLKFKLITQPDRGLSNLICLRARQCPTICKVKYQWMPKSQPNYTRGRFQSMFNH